MPYRHDHDLTLPSWGPYSKQYFGVSHLTCPDKGLRFDACLIPGRFRSEFFPPHAVKPSGWLPWDATPGLDAYSYRQQIVWKDQVYAHVSIFPDETGAHIEADLVNNTALTESLCLHLCARMTCPSLPGSGQPLRFARPNLPAGTLWTRGLDYTDIVVPKTTPYYGLNYDGTVSGEVCGHDFTHGHGLGDGFGKRCDDEVRYRVPKGTEEVLIRWRGDGSAPSHVCIQNGKTCTRVELATEKFSLHVCELEPGQSEIVISCGNGQPLQIDGLAFGPSGFSSTVTFSIEEPPLRPKVEKAHQQVHLNYSGHQYRISWDEPSCWVREVMCNDVEHSVLRLLHNHVSDVVDMGGDAHILDVFFGPVNVPAGETQRICFRIEKASKFPAPHESVTRDFNQPRLSAPSPNPAPEQLTFARDRLRAVVMSNVVFPIRVKGHWIRHLTPGRWWDSLYTWDSGCIGLGLATIDTAIATENLLAYLCDPDDKQTAFIHHGSMVPTQFYQAQEIWNRTQDRSLLEYLWPRLKQYFEYFVGWHPGSTMRPYASGLLVPWDYFYNSGGWDDYPPQHALRYEPERRKYFAPCVTSSHAIRCAKMMAGFASILDKDPFAFEQEANNLTLALQSHAWDEESGFFGYVGHDKSGKPTGILRDKNGCHFNRGMDGLSPLLAECVHGEQANRMWSTLLDPERFLTDLGLATVDRRAPYFSEAGYWNGSVWMPYQWMFWKALLDYGRPEEAYSVVSRALGIYGQEVHERYVCQEHYMIASGRGAGWHHFSGLSSPVLNLFDAYYMPGTICGGHGFFLLAQHWESDRSGCRFTGRYYGETSTPRSLLITLAEKGRYCVLVNGAPVASETQHPGCLSVTHLWGDSDFQVEVRHT